MIFQDIDIVIIKHLVSNFGQILGKTGICGKIFITNTY